MSWWNIKPITMTNELSNLIHDLVLECPVTVQTSTKDASGKNIEVLKPVSARKKSFRDRGIKGACLRTILNQIKKRLNGTGIYDKNDVDADIAMRTSSLVSAAPFSDKMFEIIVFCRRADMPDTEAIYYYVRNAMAHGSFEVVFNTNGERIYLLESAKNMSIKAQMRLKETTLQYMAKMCKMKPKEISKLQEKEQNKKQGKKKA